MRCFENFGGANAPNAPPPGCAPDGLYERNTVRMP